MAPESERITELAAATELQLQVMMTRLPKA
jgi:hypothetical protein